MTGVGLLGGGTVGSGTARILLDDGGLLRKRLGWPLKLVKVVAKDPPKEKLPQGLWSTDFADVVGNPEVRIVAELMGGLEPARTQILKALAAGQHVVTANKALLATHGREIFEAARQAGTEVMFEAAVAGGIPVIRALKEGLAANRINYLTGILNGTTNYILTRMTKEGLDFASVLKSAQEEGYAEADPTFDVEGLDAAHKLVILTALAYGVWPDLKTMPIEGIARLTPLDISFARDFGYVIKLLATASLNGGEVETRLHPAMIPAGHLLASVDGPMNAIYINGHAVGDILLYGAGAGMMPTASAVVGDIIELARAVETGCRIRVPSLGWAEEPGQLTFKDPAGFHTRYYFRFSVLDRPGVLSKIAGVLGAHDISIAQVIQKGRDRSGSVPVVILTHEAWEADVAAALQETENLGLLTGPAMLIRVEERL